MADEGFVVGGGGPGAAAPLAYTVPGTGEVILKAAFARMNGTGAGAFLPCIRIKTPNGTVMLEVIGTSVAAGASADITWFPGIGAAASTGIQFNTTPQSGTYLDATTTGLDPTNNGMLFTDTGGGGINYVVSGDAGGINGPYSDGSVHIQEDEVGGTISMPFGIDASSVTGIMYGAQVYVKSTGATTNNTTGIVTQAQQLNASASGAGTGVAADAFVAGSAKAFGVAGTGHGAGSGTSVGVSGQTVTNTGFTGLAVGLYGQIVTGSLAVPATSLPLQIQDHTGANLLIVQDNGRVLMNHLPTSSAGLASGSLWNNAGVVNIV